MAKNWKVSEAARVNQLETSERLDLGRRFPLFAILAGQLNESGMQILEAMPEHLTVRKIEATLKGEATEVEEEEVEEAVEEKPAKKAKAEKVEKPAKKAKVEEVEEEEEAEYEEMSVKELFNLCKEKGLKVEPKQPSEIYVKALKKADAAKAKAAKVEEEDEWEEEEEVKPAKKAAKGKAKKEVEEEEDDWDI